MSDLTPEDREALGDDGPECETCGKGACRDADLPAFSEPVACEFAEVYRAIKDAKDCDYGCSRDYTNQAVCLWIAPAVVRIRDEAVAALAEQVEAVLDELQARCDRHDLNRKGVPTGITRKIIADLRAVLPDRADRKDGGER